MIVFYITPNNNMVKSSSDVIKYEYIKILINNLSFNKCKNYDKKLSSSPNIKNIPKFDPESHFTYHLLLYLIDNIKCDIDKSGDFKIYCDIHNSKKFGNKYEIEFFMRLIEYGDVKIKPYNLFNKSFLKLKRFINKRYR